MKLIFTLVLVFMFLTTPSIAQTDRHGNPVFNSIPVSEDSAGRGIVNGNYYTLRNNIDNRDSSVYISDHPSLQEIIQFARTKPPYFFIIHRDKVISHMILVTSRISAKDNKSKYSFAILNPKTQKSVEIPVRTPGDVAELRARELIHNKYDEKALLLNLGPTTVCLFSGVSYSIQPFNDLKAEVLNLAKKYRLDDSDIDLSKLKN